MIKKAQVLTLSLLCLFITACKPHNKEKTKRTQYIELKNLDTWAHPDDYKIHLKMANYCREFLGRKDTLMFHAERFSCVYDNYHITSVYIGMTPIDYVPKLLTEIKKIKTLKSLSIFGTGIRNLDAYLQEMKHLKALNLKRVDLGDSVLVIPQALHTLESLSLERMSITRLEVPKECRVNELKIRDLPYPHKVINKFKHLKKLTVDAKLLIKLKDHLHKFEHLAEVKSCLGWLKPQFRKELEQKYPEIKFEFCQPEDEEVM